MAKKKKIVSSDVDQAFEDLAFNRQIHVIATKIDEEELDNVIQAMCRQLAKESGLEVGFVFNKAKQRHRQYFESGKVVRSERFQRVKI